MHSCSHVMHSCSHVMHSFSCLAFPRHLLDCYLLNEHVPSGLVQIYLSAICAGQSISPEVAGRDLNPWPLVFMKLNSFLLTFCIHCPLVPHLLHCVLQFQEELVKAMNGEAFCEFDDLQKPDCCQQM